MNLHETMVAVLSYLCSKEQALEYKTDLYCTAEVACEMQLAHTAVIKAVQLANEYGYASEYYEVGGIGIAGPAEIHFTLSPSAHDDYERKALSNKYNVNVNIVNLYSEQAIAQIGDQNTAIALAHMGVDGEALDNIIANMLNAVKSGEAALPPDKIVELTQAFAELKTEVNKPNPIKTNVIKGLSVIGNICSISTALSTYIPQLVAALGTLAGG